MINKNEVTFRRQVLSGDTWPIIKIVAIYNDIYAQYAYVDYDRNTERNPIWTEQYEAEIEKMLVKTIERRLHDSEREGATDIS